MAKQWLSMDNKKKGIAYIIYVSGCLFDKKQGTKLFWPRGNKPTEECPSAGSSK